MRFHTFATALFWRNSDFMPGAQISGTALLLHFFFKDLVIFPPATDLH